MKKPKTSRTPRTPRTSRARELANRRAVAKRRADKPLPAKATVGTAPTKKPAKKPAPAKAKAPKPKTVGRGLAAIGAATRAGDRTRWPAEIVVGTRFRLDKGDIKSLAQSINARGRLIQPVAIDGKNNLIDGERRLLAWQHELCKYRDDPIPVHVIDIDSIVAGEYDANTQRKGFTPSETVAIKRALEPRLKEAAKGRQREHAGTAPGRKKQDTQHSGEFAHSDAGRAMERVAQVSGKSRRTIEKAEAIVEAAEQEPDKFGRLKEDMDRTGRVNGPYQRLQVMRQTDAIRAAPPPLPMQGPYATVVIDFPWPFEGAAEQDEIDARGRSLRPYPAMSIKSCCHFARTQIAPILAADVSVWLWVTNYHLVRGYAHHVIDALGFTGRGQTMLTWCKDRIGRGKALRDKTEHCILLTRGNVVLNGLGDDPPTTELRAPRRDNSQKPEEFYRLVERVTPAPRYASIFSTGGEGAAWDCHGDQVGKHAAGQNDPTPDPSPQGGGEQECRANADVEASAHGQKTADVESVSRPAAGRAAAATSERIDATAGETAPFLPPSPLEGEGREGGDSGSADDAVGAALQAVTDGGVVEDAAVRMVLQKDRLITGKHKLKLTKAGRERLDRWQAERREKDALAELPDDIDGLIADYRATLERRHAAIMGPEFQLIEGAAVHGKREEIIARETLRLERLQVKAIGGTRLGMALEESPAERLHAETAAPIGEVPLWGQRGMFRIEVDGLACLIKHDEKCSLEAYACSDAPFISESGYYSLAWMPDESKIAGTVDARAVELVRTQMVHEHDWMSGKLKPRKSALPKPEKWFRLPVSWDEADAPVAIAGKHRGETDDDDSTGRRCEGPDQRVSGDGDIDARIPQRLPPADTAAEQAEGRETDRAGDVRCRATGSGEEGCGPESDGEADGRAAEGTGAAAGSHPLDILAGLRRGPDNRAPFQPPLIECPRCGESDERSVGLNKCGLCECEFFVAEKVPVQTDTGAAPTGDAQEAAPAAAAEQLVPESSAALPDPPPQAGEGEDDHASAEAAG